ncbi:MAG: hypothetical protein LBH57_05995, partial [Treponema sp.]|nr:hypothetical protein [Treponema sp.]
SGNNIPDITLDDVNITTRTVRGTVINLPPGEYLHVYALSTKSESPGYPFILDLVGEGWIEDKVWEIKVSPDAPEDLWFEVDMWNENMLTTFATKSSMSSSSIVILDINTMDSF